MIILNIDKNIVAGILGLLIPSLAITLIGISIFLASDWFDWRYYALSNLGASKDSRLVFNSALMIVGILIIIYALFIIFETYRETKLFAIPSVILLISGVALFGVGCYPMDTAPKTHWYFSVAFFTILGLSMLAYGMYYLHRKQYLLGLLGIVGFLNDLIVWKLVQWQELGITGVAIPEALSVSAPMIWLITQSIMIFKQRKIPT